MKIVDRYLIEINIAWVLVIFILCATPGQYIPSFGWLDLLSIDKLVHASMFFILSALFFINGFKKNKNQSFFLIFLCIAILYGVSLEMMQATLFINRSADWQDMIANTIGCLFAFALRKKLNHFYNTKLNFT